MTISPTLGITPIDTAPIMQFGQAASQQLQQFGQQLRQDITTIQTNQQLRGMADALPTDVDPKTNPDFYHQMNTAATQFPLAAHTSVGASILSRLGAAHADAMQEMRDQGKEALYHPLPGTNSVYQPSTGNTKQTNATPLRPVQGKVVYQKGVPVGTIDPTTGDLNTFDPNDLPTIQTEKRIKVIGNHAVDLTDPENPKVIYTSEKDRPPVLRTVNGTIVDVSDPANPKEVFRTPTDHKPSSAAEKALQVHLDTFRQAKADEIDAAAEIAKQQAKTSTFGMGGPDADVIKEKVAKIGAAKEKQNQAKMDAQRVSKTFGIQLDPTAFGEPMIPGAQPSAVPPSPPSTQQAQTPDERQQSLENARQKIKSNPNARSAVISKLKQAGFTDDEMIQAQL